MAMATADGGQRRLLDLLFLLRVAAQRNSRGRCSAGTSQLMPGWYRIDGKQGHTTIYSLPLLATNHRLKTYII